MWVKGGKIKKGGGSGLGWNLELDVVWKGWF
jgi:hypothetical protein